MRNKNYKIIALAHMIIEAKKEGELYTEKLAKVVENLGYPNNDTTDPITFVQDLVWGYDNPAAEDIEDEVYKYFSKQEKERIDKKLQENKIMLISTPMGDTFTRKALREGFNELSNTHDRLNNAIFDRINFDESNDGTSNPSSWGTAYSRDIVDMSRVGLISPGETA
jgi:hypothetical protein